MAEASRAKKPATPSLEDRISTLPDGVLEHVLGFLPADNAVRTSVLAQRWRYLWRSMRRLRLTGLDPHRHRAPAFGNFIDGLLLLRNTTVALDEAELTVYPFGENCAPINSCIRRLLFCKAKVLAVDGGTTFHGPPLISRHLRRLALNSLDFEDNSLDFERCPALEDLRITDCELFTDRILAPSVKHLSITCLH
ncbi:hypothetical protein QOZ80_9BG0700380 [Eleusine coracana subsp. coracana]|nr:hypothetical protein QOZ80_9BG0700380 [Eleusine coracana subsp. coracana]